MQQKLQDYLHNEVNCETALYEPLKETLTTIMRFATAFRSIPISKNHSLNFFLN